MGKRHEGDIMTTRNFKPKTCAWCGVEFIPTTPRSTYCTPECFKAKNRERMREYRATNKNHAHEYYATNRERILERSREYRQTHKDEIRNYKRKYYHANKHLLAGRARKYREANKERLLECRRKYDEANRERRREWERTYRANNKEAVNERIRKWRANNPDKVGAAASRRAKAELEGNATPKLIEAKWEASDHTCVLCGQPIDDTLKSPHNMSRTVEHLTPIARGGRHNLNNIGFAHWGCNSQKQDRTLEEYQEWRKQVT